MHKLKTWSIKKQPKILVHIVNAKLEKGKRKKKKEEENNDKQNSTIPRSEERRVGKECW